MFVEWLKKFLGISDLEKKVSKLEDDKIDLEKKLIKSNERDAYICNVVQTNTIMNNIQAYDFLQNIPEKEKDNALAVMNASKLVEKYDFKRFVPKSEGDYESPVITIQELADNPEHYMHKLDKGFLCFPLTLNFRKINEEIKHFTIFPNCSYSTSGGISIYLDHFKDKESTELIKHITEMSDLSRSSDRISTCIDIVDFIANYYGLEEVIAGLNSSEEEKNKITEEMRTVQMVLLSALELQMTSRIGSPEELLTETYTTEVIEYKKTIKDEIKKVILNNMEYTKSKDINELLEVRSKELFRNLASKRTNEILTNDKLSEGLTKQIGKPLSEYTIGEAVVLACYFARNVITEYKTLEDEIEHIGIKSENISGKCTDYTGLALHYLREYLVPMNPEKFEGWVFGYDNDFIGDYKHCYIKIIHILPDMNVDVYFIDPTMLANHGIEGLKKTEEILEKMDAKNLPLKIKRDAEDLLKKPINPKI